MGNIAATNNESVVFFDSIQSNYAGVIEVLFQFWITHFLTLAPVEYRQLSLTFYLSIFESIPTAKAMFSDSMNLTQQGMKFFGMFGWIISILGQQPLLPSSTASSSSPALLSSLASSLSSISIKTPGKSIPTHPQNNNQNNNNHNNNNSDDNHSEDDNNYYFVTKKYIVTPKKCLQKIRFVGKVHASLGVKATHYELLLPIFHDIMEAQFGIDVYSVRVRFCFTQVYELIRDIFLEHDFHSVVTSSSTAPTTPTTTILTTISETNSNTSSNKSASPSWNATDSNNNNSNPHFFEENMKSLDICLQNSKMCVYLELYMKQYFCYELFLFYKDYHLYQKCESKEDRDSFGTKIKYLYVMDGSQRQLNISLACKQKFHRSLITNGNTYTNTLYDEMYGEVFSLMQSSVWPNFKNEMQNLTKREMESSLLVEPEHSVLTAVDSNDDFSFLLTNGSAEDDIEYNED